ncbi:MAG: type IV secretory system conjugative DNA transfer family protein [Alphaproteobacteria bacterium]|nr:type IV secretory system conjugative DNA transfer family protein [Alphaproteobacteria bacterium]
MRLFPVVDDVAEEMSLSHKTILLFLISGILFFVSPSFAQETACFGGTCPPPTLSLSKSIPPLETAMPSAEALAAGQKASTGSSFIYGSSNIFGESETGANTETADEFDFDSLTNPNNPTYKANMLAKKAREKRSEYSELKKINGKEDGIGHVIPPPEVEALQYINESRAGIAPTITDDPVNREIVIDMRKDAQKEAALSYGARGGLAKRNYQIMERMKGFDQVLDSVFNFRLLLATTASGLLIEPPIIKESIDAMVIINGGNEAAVADKVFDINKKAKIVSAPRDWRHYLVQSWSVVPPPPRVLWPKNKGEQADWSTWIKQGWNAGFEQAEQMFELNVNQLVADYTGMVRYRMLLAQGMISEPYSLHEDRGITSDENQMRVGDRALKITGPSQFLTGAELWKPADR